MPTIDELKQWAWNNATAVEGYNPVNYRKDACGAWISWDKFGVHESPFGWEIDYILPISKGGTSRLENVRAMQHKNKASKSNSYPYYKAVMTSEGDHNTPCDIITSVNNKKREELSKIYNL